jgi:hypothetical protein
VACEIAKAPPAGLVFSARVSRSMLLGSVSRGYIFCENFFFFFNLSRVCLWCLCFSFGFSVQVYHCFKPISYDETTPL